MRKSRLMGAALALIGVLALALVGCGATATAQGTPRQQTQVSSMRAILTSEFPQNHIPPFDKTSTNPAKAEAFYKEFLALPVQPPGAYSCPIDLGAVYHLFFANAAGKVIATATIDAGGCEIATLPNGAHRWAQTSPNFWNDLATTLNVSPAALQPMTHPSGPSAPTSLPN